MLDILQKKGGDYPISYSSRFERIEPSFNNMGLLGLLLTTSIVVSSCTDNASDTQQSFTSHTDSQVSRDAASIDEASINTDTSLINDNDPHSDAGLKNDSSLNANFASDSGFIEDSQIYQNGETNKSCIWELIFPMIGTNTLQAIWGSAEDDVYAVGGRGTLLHYDGSKWNKIDMNRDYHLLDIWGSDQNNIYAVGIGADDSNSPSISHPPILLHFNGQEWIDETVPEMTYSENLAVWGTGPENVFVSNDGYIWRFDGSTWKQTLAVKSDNVQQWSRWSDIFGCDQNQILATDLSSMAIYQFDGTAWRFFMNLPVDLASSGTGTAWCGSINDIWLFTAFNQNNPTGVVHWNGLTWTPLHIEAPETASYKFTNMFETTDGKRYLVGWNGILMTLEVDVWRAIPTETDENLHAIWAKTSDELFLAGVNSVLLRVHPDGVQNDNSNILKGTISDFLDLGKEGFVAVSNRGDLLMGDAQQQRIVPYNNPDNISPYSAIQTQTGDILLGGYDCPDSIHSSGDHCGMMTNGPVITPPFYTRGLPTRAPDDYAGPPGIVQYDGSDFTHLDLGSYAKHLDSFAVSGNRDPVYIDVKSKAGFLHEGRFVDFSSQPPAFIGDIVVNDSGDIYVIGSAFDQEIVDPAMLVTVLLFRYEDPDWTEVASLDILAGIPIDVTVSADGEPYIFDALGNFHRYNGNRLEIATGPIPLWLMPAASQPMVLSAVVNAPDDIYFAPGPYYYNGLFWEKVTMGGQDLNAQRVFGLDNGDVVAVQSFPPSWSTAIRIYHFNGISWTELSLPEEMSGTLASIWGKSINDHYIGMNGGRQIWHYNGTSISIVDSPTSGPIEFLESADSGIWVASKYGDVFRLTESGWITERESPLHCNGIVDLHRIEDEALALCDSGDILRREGSQWHLFSPQTPCKPSRVGGLNYRSLWGDSLDNIFIFGVDSNDGASPPLCHYDGQSWSEIPGIDKTPKAVWGQRDDLYILIIKNFVDKHNNDGSQTATFCEAAIQHYNGTNWDLIACSDSFESISTASEWITSGPGLANFVLTFGVESIMSDEYQEDAELWALYYNGTRWQSFTVPNPVLESTGTLVAWCAGETGTGFYAATYGGSVYYRTCE